jgi:membrane protein YdbS with pleckstrin-like domain
VTNPSGPAGPAEPTGAKPPSVVPAAILLGLAAVLIVVVLIKPAMPQWLRISIAILAVLVVIALLVYAAKLFRDNARRGRR